MEQVSIFDYLYEPYEIRNKIRLIELFAGYGSQACALRNLGADFEHYRVVEWDKYAILSYNSIHHTDFPTMDVTKVHGEDLGIVDREHFTYLLTYSFPCTDISIAGRQMGMAEGSGTRSSMLWQVKRILEELKETDTLPQVLLMENVTAIHSEENMPHYRKWLDFLDILGYSTYTQDLNAADYGISQHRERTFALSILGQYCYKFPIEMELNKDMEYYFEDMTDEEGLKYVVKQKKALDLMVELNEKGELI